MKRKFLVISVAVVLIAVLFGVRAYNRERNRLEARTVPMMDTYVSIYISGPREQARQALDRAFARLGEIAVKFNPHDAHSPVYQFNEQGVPITDREILEVVGVALKVSQLSGGAFDPGFFNRTQV